MSKTIRIACGSAYGNDATYPAAHAVRKADLDYLCCDRMAEISLARAVSRKNEDPSKGYDVKLEEFFSEILPIAYENDTTIIGSFGMANPDAAGRRVRDLAAEMGYTGLSIATITGDDVLPQLQDETFDPEDFDEDKMSGTTPRITGRVVDDLLAAHAYLGIDPIVEALEADADVVIGGRLSDSAPYAAVMAHELGWARDDWGKLARGYTVGHLLECGRGATGAHMAYPGYVEVPDINNMGAPMAVVTEQGDGEAEVIITKPEGTGGIVTELSVAAQLVYEVEDPKNYYHPDVVVDLSEVELEQVGDHEVQVTGSKGKPQPDNLKVNAVAHGGYQAEMEMGWAGPDSLMKARAHIEQVLEPRLTDGVNNIRDEVDIDDYRIDIVGVDSVFGSAAPDPDCDPNEVRVRVAASVDTEADAEKFYNLMEPDAFFTFVGAGGPRKIIEHQTELYATLIPREDVETEVRYAIVDAPSPTAAAAREGAD